MAPSHSQNRSISTLSSLRSASSDPSTESYGLRSLQPEFKQRVQALIDDLALSEDALYAQAKKHLQVLRDPHVAVHTRPAWISRAKRTSYTIERMFTAMFAVADELKLHAGRRYVSATICACASEAAGGPSRDEAAAADELPRALEGVATTWVAYMLWPCELCCWVLR